MRTTIPPTLFIISTVFFHSIESSTREQGQSSRYDSSYHPSSVYSLGAIQEEQSSHHRTSQNPSSIYYLEYIKVPFCQLLNIDQDVITGFEDFEFYPIINLETLHCTIVKKGKKEGQFQTKQVTDEKWKQIVLKWSKTIKMKTDWVILSIERALRRVNAIREKAQESNGHWNSEITAAYLISSSKLYGPPSPDHQQLMSYNFPNQRNVPLDDQINRDNPTSLYYHPALQLGVTYVPQPQFLNSQSSQPHTPRQLNNPDLARVSFGTNQDLNSSFLGMSLRSDEEDDSSTISRSQRNPSTPRTTSQASSSMLKRMRSRNKDQ